MPFGTGHCFTVMARKSPNDNLRAQVRALQGAVTKKVSYNRRVKGVELGGTDYDPRVDPSKIKRLNKPQLERLASTMQTFMNRKTAFVSLGPKREVVPASEWRGLKGVERRVNAVGKRIENNAAKIVIPNLGMTVEDYDKTIRPERISAAGDATNRPFDRRNRKPEQVNGLAALRKLREGMEAKLQPGYIHARLDKARDNMASMLNQSGANNLVKDLYDLDDEQFNVLISHWHFAEALSPKYQEARNSNIDADFEDSMTEVKELLRDAKSLVIEKPLLPRRPKAKR